MHFESSYMVNMYHLRKSIHNVKNRTLLSWVHGNPKTMLNCPMCFHVLMFTGYFQRSTALLVLVFEWSVLYFLFPPIPPPQKKKKKLPISCICFCIMISLYIPIWIWLLSLSTTSEMRWSFWWDWWFWFSIGCSFRSLSLCRNFTYMIHMLMIRWHCFKQVIELSNTGTAELGHRSVTS